VEVFYCVKLVRLINYAVVVRIDFLLAIFKISQFQWDFRGLISIYINHSANHSNVDLSLTWFALQTWDIAGR